MLMTTFSGSMFNADQTVLYAREILPEKHLFFGHCLNWGGGGLDTIVVSKFADILVESTNTVLLQIQDLPTLVLVIAVPNLGLEIWDSQNWDSS